MMLVNYSVLIQDPLYQPWHIHCMHVCWGCINAAKSSERGQTDHQSEGSVNKSCLACSPESTVQHKCFMCKQGCEGKLVKCSTGRCGHFYHLECVRVSQQVPPPGSCPNMHVALQFFP